MFHVVAFFFLFRGGVNFAPPPPGQLGLIGLKKNANTPQVQSERYLKSLSLRAYHEMSSGRSTLQN